MGGESKEEKKEAKRLAAEKKREEKERRKTEKEAEKERKRREKAEEKLKKKQQQTPTKKGKTTTATTEGSSSPSSSAASTSQAQAQQLQTDDVAQQPQTAAQAAKKEEGHSSSEIKKVARPEPLTPVDATAVAAAAKEEAEEEDERQAVTDVAAEEEGENEEEKKKKKKEEDDAPPPVTPRTPVAAAAADAADATADAEESDNVAEMRKNDGGGISRNRGHGKSSIRGAPAQLLPGQRSENNSKRASADAESANEVDTVEDEVGEMASKNAQETANYLRVLIDKLRDRMAELYDNGTNRGYQKAYQSLAMVGQQHVIGKAMEEPNRLKNRYANINPYDHSRVVLPLAGGDPYSDYINASWVDGYKKHNGYIASQGPVPNSFIDFWRMVWEAKAVTIVMVTHEVEGGRMKCHRYWPDPTSNPPVTTLTYGNLTVTHLGSVAHKHFVVRTFQLQGGNEERTIKQFAYTSWPDHGVPLTTAEMLGFRNAVNYGTPNKDVPIVIHCSAGVGRTGTYIAIDTLVKQALDMGGELNVDAIVASMRERRNYMVQTEVQYMFIYRCVLDGLTELLRGESRKAKILTTNGEEQAAIREAAAAAELAQKEEEQREQAAINAAKAELLAREGASAANAAAVVSMSISQRMAQLKNAEEQWIENYRKSLEEWNERNQFEAEVYDLTSTLTPVQSRLEALKQKGLLV